MTDFSGALQDLGAVISGPSVDSPAQPLPAQGPFAAVLGDIQNAKPAEPVLPPPPTGTPNYTGSILPVSTDEKGNASLDWNAGIPGMVGRAFNAASAPADVFEGRQPINDPKLTNRAIDFAEFFSPASVALRAGELIPGEMAIGVVPTARQLKDAGSAGYNALRDTGMEINPDAVSQMASGLQNDLTRKGFGAAVAPSTHSIIDQIANPSALAAGEKRIATIDDLLAMRQNFGNVSSSPQDQAAGGIAKRAIDDFLGSVSPKDVVAGTATPEAAINALREANANYAASQRSNTLTGALDRGNTGIESQALARAHAANSGLNLDNTIRQRVANLLQNEDKIAGFSQPEIDALNHVIEGGPVRNASRRVGNLLGGGQGMHGGALGTAGAVVGAMYGGPEGAGIGAAVPILGGAAAKSLENSLSRRALGGVDEMVRMNSPLARALATEDYLAQPAIGRNSAVLRSLLPGLFSSAPPQPSAPTPQSLARLLAPSA